MLVHAAEESFRRGLHGLRVGRQVEALALFEAAIELERRMGPKEIQARYLSYYGVTLALLGKRLHDGVYFCRQAIQREPYNGELYFNLGRACLRAGRRREAHVSLIKGLRLHPGHPGMLRVLDEMGCRRAPVVPFLPRRNPLNVLLGRLTHALGVKSREPQTAS